MTTVQLRRMAWLNPATPEFLSTAEDVTFVPLEAVWSNGRADFSRRADVADVASGYTRFRAGDVLQPKVTPTFAHGRSTVAAIDTPVGAASTEVHVLRAKSHACARYLAYVGQSRPFISEGMTRVEGVGNLLRVPPEFVAQYRLPLMSRTEQEEIADFLDRETAQIDAMIEAQEHLLTLTHERRRAAIAYHLDAERCCLLGPRMKHVVTGVRQGVSPQCLPHPADGVSEWGVLKVGCVNSGIFNALENKKLPDEISPDPSCVPGIGDIVISRANTRTLLGSAAVVTKAMPRLMLSDKLYAFNVGHNNPHFIALILGTRPYRDLIEIEATGTSDSMQNISLHSILDLPMNVPTLDEQNERVARLQTTLRTMDTLIIGVHEMLSLLRERREALITAAVSGRIDPTTGIERIEEAS
jgi:hypothetical protein